MNRNENDYFIMVLKQKYTSNGKEECNAIPSGASWPLAFQHSKGTSPLYVECHISSKKCYDN